MERERGIRHKRIDKPCNIEDKSTQFEEQEDDVVSSCMGCCGRADITLLLLIRHLHLDLQHSLTYLPN